MSDAFIVTPSFRAYDAIREREREEEEDHKTKCHTYAPFCVEECTKNGWREKEKEKGFEPGKPSYPSSSSMGKREGKRARE